MKERPILFSAPMVRALLAGTKTQTRRIVKPQPGTPEGAIRPTSRPNDWVIEHWARAAREMGNFGRCENVACPYGVPGDRLWVREDHYRYGHWEPVPGVRTKTGRMKWRFVADTDEVRFDPPESFRKGRHTKDPETPAWHKRLGRFMPRALSRLTLELTEVRVERLQDITHDDAVAEGARCWICAGPIDGTSENECACFHTKTVARESYRELWTKINGPGSWDANPWVWVLHFRGDAH